MVRTPVFAGRFYPASAVDCTGDLDDCLSSPAGSSIAAARLYGAIVPHAGWAYSGRVTARVLHVLAERSAAETVVLLGATHMSLGRRAALFSSGWWESPLGRVAVDEQLSRRLCAASPHIVEDAAAHAGEHSLEVQVPFIQRLFPQALIVPILVPPLVQAIDIGRAIGEVLATWTAPTVVVGTTDLTHYGPRYHMTDHGTGQAGLDWARQVNDRRMIEVILAMDPGPIVPEATTHRNACGPGAVAATMAACHGLGARSAILIEHTTSQAALAPASAGGIADAVGYAGFVFA